MASQRGIALSTYLSKQAQSSKKRFAAQHQLIPQIMQLVMHQLVTQNQRQFLCPAVAQPLEDGEELLRQAAEGLQLKKMPAAAVSAAVQGPMDMGCDIGITVTAEESFPSN